MKNHVRIVTATSLFDGHDASINIMRRLFLTVVILFGTITLSSFTGIPFIGHMAGWIGILCGSMAMYSAHKGMGSE
jgi:succinate-acetate transporter protein